jgi:hypothetical protein
MVLQGTGYLEANSWEGSRILATSYYNKLIIRPDIQGPLSASAEISAATTVCLFCAAEPPPVG